MILIGAALASVPDFEDEESLRPTTDATGEVQTVSDEGAINRRNPFFRPLGTNGRSCSTCHQAEDGWSITPAHVQARFEATGGTDPIFRTNDGSNSPTADVSTVAARRTAYSLLLNKGLIRVGLPIPAGAEFELAAADDPYGHASAAELSLFRRPLPSTNLGFLSGVMWDGRETTHPITGNPDAALAALRANLTQQARNATLGHAQGAAPTDRQLAQIVDFELALFTAQVSDNLAGRLDRDGANGGPRHLSRQGFYIGINDTLGADPTGAPFDPAAFTLFDKWADLPHGNGRGDGHDSSRAAVARGQALFNTRAFDITNVGGLNDALGQATIRGTCTTCHNSPNVGNHSVALPLNLGLAGPRGRTPDLPLYTLRNRSDGRTVQTTDPGRALITGKWADIGKFKGPILRGLAARPPYFHNGSAATIADAVNFYNGRFGIGLTQQEKSDLVAFLLSL